MNAESLEQSLEAIVDPNAIEGGPSIMDALQEVETVLKNDTDSMDPQLRHFLERRSYVKALEHLRTINA